MEFQRLEVKIRTVKGKGPSRKIRQAGRVPGVVYGQDIKPLTIDLAPRDLRSALQGPHRRNTVLKLVVKGDDGPDSEMLVMLQDHQNHPRDRNLLHVDFLKVALDREVDVDVPLVATGRCQGVQMGGILLQMFHELPLRCKPDSIPVEIVHDITAINIGQSVKVSELPLPGGVKVLLEPEQAVLSVAAPEAEEEKPPEEEEEAAEGEEKEEEKEADKAKPEDRKESEKRD